MSANSAYSPLTLPGFSKARGFTLIELVIGIVVFAIAMSLFSSLLVPQAKRSIEPIYQIRASELGESLLNEIAGKAFDEQSNRVGGTLRCNDGVAPPCSDSADFGAGGDGENFRADFDDVDDYHGLSEQGGSIKNSLGNNIQVNGVNLYQGFEVNVSVVYQDIGGGLSANSKLITVTLTTPSGEDLVFSSYRSNY
jgi:MSHA pilin protein MshD